MKAPYAVYPDFECVLRKISSFEPGNKQSFTVKTEKHEPCGFSYMVVRSDGATFGPFTYRGEDAVLVFLVCLQNHEREMREDMANKRPLVMTNEDWQKHRHATDCRHICKSLVKDMFLDSISVHDPDSGKYCGQSHRIFCFMAMKTFMVPRRERKPKDEIDQWVANNQETCFVLRRSTACANYKDSVKDDDHVTGRYRGAAHNECNFKLKLNEKTAPIAVFFHNLKGYDGHLLMHTMARVQGEIKCIPNEHRKIHLIFTGKSEICRQCEFSAEKSGQAGEGERRVPNHA